MVMMSKVSNIYLLGAGPDERNLRMPRIGNQSAIEERRFGQILLVLLLVDD
jgi:hypothetical protein